MVFLALDDPTGGAEVVVFNSTYAHARELCVADRILVVKGRIDHKQQGETKLIALEVVAVRGGARAAEVRFRLDARAGAGPGSSASSRGSCRTTPASRRSTSRSRRRSARRRSRSGPAYRVAIDADFLNEARTLLGAEALQ